MGSSFDRYIFGCPWVSFLTEGAMIRSIDGVDGWSWFRFGWRRNDI
jgi:hypothetical protein